MDEIITKQVEENVNKSLSQSTVSQVPHQMSGLRPWKPGQSGNPSGRHFSISKEIRKRLLQYDPGYRKTLLQELIQVILNKALEEKDEKIIRLLWNYVEGLPKQQIEHSGGLGIVVLPSEVINKNKLDASDSSTIEDSEGSS